jgi:SAM-dependent methyltransferase
MHSDNPILDRVYAAESDEERRAAYDEWAATYDRDVTAFGIRLPYVAACVFARFVEPGSGPILDAGCGTAMHTLPLALMGYQPFHGIDISEGMLAVSGELGIYESLQRMALGRELDLPGDHFAVSYAIGVLAPGHAPPESLDEIIRVTRRGGLVIFSTHADETDDSRPFHEHRQRLTEGGLWQPEFRTEPFVSLPRGDARVRHAVYVYRKA